MTLFNQYSTQKRNTMFKEIFEAQKIALFKGSEQEVQSRMDALFAYDEKNNYQTQQAEIVSYTNDYKTYYIRAENPAGYKANKKIIDKYIK